MFQDAGYDGTEDDFYENVFPDLDRGTQTLLSQVGETGTVSIEGLGSDYKRILLQHLVLLVH